MVLLEPSAIGLGTPVLKVYVRPGPRSRLPRARKAHTVNAWYVPLCAANHVFLHQILPRNL